MLRLGFARGLRHDWPPNNFAPVRVSNLNSKSYVGALCTTGHVLSGHGSIAGSPKANMRRALAFTPKRCILTDIPIFLL